MNRESVAGHLAVSWVGRREWRAEGELDRRPFDHRFLAGLGGEPGGRGDEQRAIIAHPVAQADGPENIGQGVASGALARVWSIG